MYKLVVFAAVLAVATAAPGFYGAHLAAPAFAAPAFAAPAIAAPYAPFAHGVVAASPFISAAPVVKTTLPVATSYANTVRIASPAVVAAHAPLVASPAYAHGW